MLCLQLYEQWQGLQQSELTSVSKGGAFSGSQLLELCVVSMFVLHVHTLHTDLHHSFSFCKNFEISTEVFSLTHP